MADTTSPTSPVLALSRSSLTSDVFRGLAEVADEALADLVKRRWRLARAQGWVVVGSFAVTFGAVLAAAALVPSEWVLAGMAAVCLSVSVSLGFFVEAATWRVFRDEARPLGLSEDTTRQIYEKAASAEDWASVLRTCGAEPTDSQIASFVRPGAEE